MQENALQAIRENTKIVFPDNAPRQGLPKLIGRLWYYYSLSVVAFLFLFAMPPVMLWARLRGNKDYAYPWAQRGARFWLRASGMKIKVRGAENLEEGKSYVFISNHHSYLDTAMMFGCTGRKMGVIAKKELKKLPVAGRFMDYVNVLAIDRSDPQKAIETMDEAREKMRSGVSFGVFAEGTRAYPHELLPFKKGAFHLALETGAPIAPVAMKYTDYAMGKKQKYATPTVCEMVILPSVETKGLTAENDLMDLLKTVREAIAEEMSKE